MVLVYTQDLVRIASRMLRPPAPNFGGAEPSGMIPGTFTVPLQG
jgi:hypothetical protein